MSDDGKDPREPRAAGWDYSVPLYQISLPGTPKGTVCAVGTDFPGREGVSSYVAHLELQQPLNELEGRRLLRQVYRALMASAAENRAWGAAAQLGGEDPPSNLPWSRPGAREAHCFWMMLTEYPKPVLAFRTPFAQKETLKKLFDENFRGSEFSRSGWRKEAKVWWIYSETGYPKLLGRLRTLGFKLKWINRPGFPPAPPVEENL